jgi:type IV secretory pathway protease TraF
MTRWLLIGLVVLALLTRYVKVNVMGSLPYGVYWLMRPAAVVIPGQIVLVQTPTTTALMRTLHGSLSAAWPLLKRVAAVGGDPICRLAGTLYIDGRPWGPVYVTSPTGERLPHWLADGECRVVPTGEVFVASDQDGSLDSRYVGTIPLAAIHAQAVPLWTW